MLKDLDCMVLDVSSRIVNAADVDKRGECLLAARFLKESEFLCSFFHVSLARPLVIRCLY